VAKVGGREKERRRKEIRGNGTEKRLKEEKIMELKKVAK